MGPFRQAVVLLCIFALLGGCGQKGPLKLPPKSASVSMIGSGLTA